jgi:biopolymer transport protein ExbD
MDTAPSAVLTVGRNELYFFEGKKLAKLTLREHLESFVDTHTGNTAPVLLLKTDASIPSSRLFNLMDVARQAGFTEIHLAAELNAEILRNEDTSSSGRQDMP